MPTYEYLCTWCNKRFEEFFKSFGEAKEFMNGYDCPHCGKPACRVTSPPLEAHLYGNPEGYGKPSPTKRYNNRLVSSKEGNKSAIG